MKRGPYPVTRLSPPGSPAIHAYYDICPESSDRTRVLYCRFDGPPPAPADVVVLHLDTGEHEIVAHVSASDAHSGVMQSWVGDNRIIYRNGNTDVRESLVLDLRTGEQQKIDDSVRQVSPDGRFTLTTGELQPGVDGDAAVYRFDLDTGGRVRMFTRAEALAVHPRLDELHEPEGFRFQNAKWSPDGTRFLVMLTNAHAGDARTDPYVHAAMVADANGSNIRHVADIGHHPMWTPEGDGVYYYHTKPETETHDLILQPLDGERQVLAVDHPGVHATLSRDGRFAISDRLLNPGAILLTDLTTGEHETLAEYTHVDYTHATGCHPHPVWSHDERRIYFNAADDGQPALYMIDLDG